MLKKVLSISLSLIGALVLFVSVANAAVLQNASLTLSNSRQGSTGVTYTFQFDGTATNLGSMTFQFCQEASGSTCSYPASLDFGSSTISLIEDDSTDDAANWTGGVNFATDTVTIERDTQKSGDADGTWEVAFDNITNPNASQCNLSSNSSTGTCYVRIITYTDTNASTSADQTTVSMTITQSVTVSATVDPSFTMVVTGVDPALTATANGTTLTTGITPTVTTIPFGNLQPATPKFLAQAVTVSTNANGGYSISAVMNNNMTGTAYGDDIDPFTGNSANFTTTSGAWTTPTGTASGTDTGWLGIGTDDADVDAGTDDEFYSLGTTPTTVSSQSTSASNETDIYIVGIEVNAFQLADSYQGTLRYNALPTY